MVKFGQLHRFLMPQKNLVKKCSARVPYLDSKLFHAFDSTLCQAMVNPAALASHTYPLTISFDHRLKYIILRLNTKYRRECIAWTDMKDHNYPMV